MFLLTALVACGGAGAPCLIGGGTSSHDWVTHLANAAPRLSPRWTPDSGSIIFAGPSNNGGNIYVVSSGGSSLRRISKSKGNLFEIDYTPDVSPNGDRIVYATSRHGEDFFGGTGARRRNFEIETTDLRGNDRQRLTEDRGDDLLPRWSPDGESILFLSFGSETDPNNGTGIYVMEADGSSKRRIVTFLSRWFAWSPSGDAIAYLIRDFLWSESVSLEVAASDGSNPRRIFTTQAREIQAREIRGSLQPDALGEILGEPAWSPNGRSLAFLYHHKDDIPNDSNGCGNENPGMYLCIVDSDGSGVSSKTLSVDSSWDGTSLAWSPDGRLVLLTEFRKSSIIQDNSWVGSIGTETSFREFVDGVYITSMDVTTGDTHTVAPGAYASWSPDGSRIAVLGKYDDGGYLATVAPDGSDFRVLVKADEDGDLELADN